VQAVEQASSSRRASVAAFLSTAPGFSHPVVEHIVLFKVKPDADPVQTQAMLDALHELRKLEGVLELTVGSALSVYTCNLLSTIMALHFPSLNPWHGHVGATVKESTACMPFYLQVQGGEYTHVLHGRYQGKEALEAYLANPDHVKIQKEYMQGLTEDVIVVDWECIPYGPVLENTGAKRITLVKTKDDTSADDMRFLVDSIPRLPSKYDTQLFLFTNFLITTEHISSAKTHFGMWSQGPFQKQVFLRGVCYTKIACKFLPTCERKILQSRVWLWGSDW
jgi:hypothetical protein